MPYNYTPSPNYVSPVQLASDGDPATSGAIMGPVEQALDNACAVLLLGSRSIRHVDSLAALAALTGMAHNEVALVASPQASGYPGTSLGVFRFIEGDLSPFDDNWRVNATDASGVWVWMDLSRLNVSDGLLALDSSREIGVGTNVQAQGINVIFGGSIDVQHSSARLFVRNGAELQVQDGSKATVDENAELVLEAAVSPLVDPGGRLSVRTGGSALVSGGGIHLESGGGLWAHSGSAQHIESGSSLEAAEGTTVSLLGTNEIRFRVNSIGAPTGTYSIGAHGFDEVAFGSGTATVDIIDPGAHSPPLSTGHRIRITRQTMADTGNITVNASGTAYELNLASGTGHMRWVEFTVHTIGILNKWVPSAYAMT